MRSRAFLESGPALALADEAMLELHRSFHLFPRNVSAITTHARNETGAAGALGVMQIEIAEFSSRARSKN